MKCERCGKTIRMGADNCESCTDVVSRPGHYTKYPFEVIDVIEVVLNELCQSLTPFQCYCVGNQLKYRLRAGHKGSPVEDIAKAEKYREFFEGRFDSLLER